MWNLQDKLAVGSVRNGAGHALAVWLPGRALYSVGLSCLVCAVTAPTLMGQGGGEMTGIESLHGEGAQQTLASVVMNRKGRAD